MRAIFGVTIGLALALTAPVKAETIGKCPATDYGNGVYYLQCSEVGPALAELRGKYPNSVLTFTYYAYVLAGNLGAQGYYVVVNPPAVR